MKDTLLHQSGVVNPEYEEPLLDSLCRDVSSTPPGDCEKQDFGVSLRNALDPVTALPDHQWIIFRASYQKEKSIADDLTSKGILTYLPMHNVYKRVGKKLVHKRRPMINSMLFAYTTFERASDFLANSGTKDSIPYLHYYYDHTRKNSYGRDIVATLSLHDMKQFVKITSVDSDFVKLIDQDREKFRELLPGQQVRIMSGPFQGIIGKYIRLHQHNCVAIELPHIGMIHTAYIPQHSIEVITE